MFMISLIMFFYCLLALLHFSNFCSILFNLNILKYDIDIKNRLNQVPPLLLWAGRGGGWVEKIELDCVERAKHKTSTCVPCSKSTHWTIAWPFLVILSILVITTCMRDVIRFDLILFYENLKSNQTNSG